MMASPRPSDPPPPSPEDAPKPVAPKPRHEDKTATLGTSNFIVGFDWVLSVGVLALAFLAVSFSVRNADFWQHLAVGRLIAEGGYSFGRDPFSYVDPDRTWVNHAWLFDLLIFWIFKAVGGPGLVVAKGIVIVATAGLLLAARRPAQAVWGNVVCVGLALLAAAPRLMIQPTLASYFFLSVLLCVLIRAPKFFRGVRLYVLVAGVFGLWANMDQWFFLGPLLVGLYTLGLFIRPTEEGDKSLRKELLIALGLGMVAINLNPHHVRVWTFPPELVSGELAELFATDGEFGPTFRSAFTKGALDFAGERDNPVNTYSLVVLLFLTVAGFVGSLSRLSIPLMLVWAGFVGLAVLHLRAIPFLAFVAAPIAAAHLTDCMQRLVDRPMPEGTVRLLSTGRLMTRVMLALGGLVLLTASYPGWLHPFNLQRRWKWELEPNESIVKAAENLQRLRADGSLPAEAHLLNLQPDFACYLAWYAPAEKSFFDYRLAYHAPEAAEYVALRRQLSPYDSKEKPNFDLPEFLDRWKITHVVTAHGNRVLNQIILGRLWQASDPFREPEFVIWNVHGRAVTLGRTKQKVLTAAQFDALRFDPKKAAFAQTPMPEAPNLDPPLVDREPLDRFMAPPPISPAEAEECYVLELYRSDLLNQFVARHQAGFFLFELGIRQLKSKVGIELRFLDYLVRFVAQYPLTLPPDVTATGILAVRSARRAVIASPNHPDGYAFLASVYPDSHLSLSQDFAKYIATVNMARALNRVPADLTQRRSAIQLDKLALNLRQAHLAASPQRIDMAVFANRLAVTAMRNELDEMENVLASRGAEGQQELNKHQQQLTNLEKELGLLEKQAQIRSDKFTNESVRLTEPLDRATVARREGLAMEAMAELTKANDRFQKKLTDFESNPDKKPTEVEFGVHLAMVGDLIELMLFNGQVEQAVGILDTVVKDQSFLANLTPPMKDAYVKARMSAARLLGQSAPYDQDPAGRFRILRVICGLITGDYERTITAQQEDTRKARDNLASFMNAVFPKGPPASVEIPTLMSIDIDIIIRVMTNPVDSFGAVIGSQSRHIHASMLYTYQNLVNAQGQQHAQLGLTYLEAGDIRSARAQFQEVLKGPELPSASPSRMLAREMLKLLGE